MASHQRRLLPRRCAARSRRRLPAGVDCVYEIVIDGLTLEAVERGHARGHRGRRPARASCAITAGNYGGKLGQLHFHLRELSVT